MSKRKTPYVIDNFNRFLVESESTGIHPLVSLSELSSIMFDGDNTVFHEVSDVIAWHEKELRETRGQSGNADVCNALKEALGKFSDGKVVQE